MKTIQLLLGATVVMTATFFPSVAADCDPNVCPMNAYGANDFYCMPWDPNNRNCQPKPTTCGEQHTDYAVDEAPIATFYSITPDECCRKCTDYSGCKVYTFVNFRQGPPACFLNGNGVKVRYQQGAVLGVSDK